MTPTPRAPMLTPCSSVLLAALLAGALGWQSVLAENAAPEVIVVTANRGATAELDSVANIARLDDEELRSINATHPHEIGVRVPGVWIGRGSGQEHLTAIRSPVLTGPGSCGAFLVLEDSIPTRPAGFCNVNQMFEIPTELAAGVEVIRGPSGSLYGSNGLHGTVNTLLPSPGEAASTDVRLDTGSNDYWRGRLRFDTGPGDNAFAGGFMYDRDGGYRDDSGYNQAKLYGKSSHRLNDGELGLAVSGSWLEQETAGFITGEDAYKGPDRFRNQNPEAYRDAYSVRVGASWLPEPGEVWAPEWRTYLRNSDMRFLQHFLPTQPTEKNGQTSGGLTFLTRRDVGQAARLTLGIDTEVARGYLEETQVDGEVGFLPERPDGKHYDYEVDSYMAAAFASVTVPLAARWELQAGVRGEFMRYDYDNRMLDGATKDDGSACQDDGADIDCLYFRPADRTDNFFNLSPNIGLLYRFTDETVAFTNLSSGFRAPQAAELYRLQAQQAVGDIDSERLDSIETGVRHIGASIAAEAVAFYMRKRNFIFRDAEGLNVSDGRTRHYGVELNFDWRFIEYAWFALTGSWSKQKYDFDRNAGLGEVILKGNEVDTAPQILGSARLGYEFGPATAELEYVYQDPYFLDAANTAEYEGHDLLNLRLSAEPAAGWLVALRVNNLTDVKYADRADLFSVIDQYRYFPGREREYFLELGWRTR